MEEVWYPIPDYEGLYELSNLLRIKSLEQKVIASDGKEYVFKERIMKIYVPTSNDYAAISLIKNGEYRRIKVHRLIAKQFVPNPENKEQINHKNGNKRDYRIENLEWVTKSENAIHAKKNGFLKFVSSKLVLDLCTGIYYDSIKEASIAKCIHDATLGKKLHGQRKNNTSLILV